MSEKVVKEICKLLSEKDSEIQRSCAIVLGEIAPYIAPPNSKNHKIISDSLVKSLNTHNFSVKTSIIEAIGKVKAVSALPVLIKCLNEHHTIRSTTISAINKFGEGVLVQLEKISKNLDLEGKRSIVDILGNIQSTKAVEILIDWLKSKDLEFVKHICFVLRERMRLMNSQEKKIVSKRVSDFLKFAESRKENQYIISALKVSGFLSDHAFIDTLLKYAKYEDISIRTHAITALSTITIEEKDFKKVQNNLVDLLNHSDYTGVVSKVLLILNRIKPQPVDIKVVRSLLNSQHFPVKLYAIKLLSTGTDKESFEIIFNILNSENEALRRESANVLKAQKKYAKFLFEEFAKFERIKFPNLFSEICRLHKDLADKKFLKDLLEKTVLGFENPGEKEASYFEFLKEASVDLLRERFIERAISYVKKEDFERAERYLWTLESRGISNADSKFFLALCRIKNKNEDDLVKDKNPSSPFSLLSFLLKETKKTLKERLKHFSKFIEQEDFYKIGLILSTGMGLEREFGLNLLKSIYKKSPSSQIGKRIKRTLQEAGLFSSKRKN